MIAWSYSFFEFNKNLGDQSEGAVGCNVRKCSSGAVGFSWHSTSHFRGFYDLLICSSQKFLPFFFLSSPWLQWRVIILYSSFLFIFCSFVGAARHRLGLIMRPTSHMRSYFPLSTVCDFMRKHRLKTWTRNCTSSWNKSATFSQTLDRWFWHSHSRRE